MNKFWTVICSVSLTLNSVILLAICFVLGSGFSYEFKKMEKQEISSVSQPVKLSKAEVPEELDWLSNMRQ